MKSLNNLNRFLASLTLTLTACGNAPDSVADALGQCPAPSPLGMCVDVGGDVPVFRPCDQIDFLSSTCTFRVLDTTQTRALNQTMTEEACQQIK